MRKLYQILYNVGRLTDAPGRRACVFWRIVSFQGGDTLGSGALSLSEGHFGVGRFARWKGARSYEARFSPSRSPFPGTLFWTYVVVCDTLLIGWWIWRYREFKAEPMNEGGRKSGPHSGPVPWYEIYILWYLTESSKFPAELRKAISSGWGLACIRRSAGSIW